ncbi:MAG: A/G-specific adenine glycosylase [Firmicutes bacterium]|nr:A/G-specific adenine glycosylase [Alicyclobacillaceae bacterium]MCL6496636.1 A/G-specific adenine glycosylase [Bacillota bacterium]
MKRLRLRATVDPARLLPFREGILDWYRHHGRDLPWRRTRDPYAILVSEILLHQTQVRTVIPVYEQFLRRFPTVAALAAASLAEVKALTDPLGYKVRGQWLHQIARYLMEHHRGEVPGSLPELLRLPGIGRYTAGAVLSFGFGQDAPILDTNVNRLLGRYFGVDWRDSHADTRHRLWALAEAVIPPGQGPTFNQALMDMGALVCTARRPTCLLCPVRGGCLTGGEVARSAEAPATYAGRAQWPGVVFQERPREAEDGERSPADSARCYNLESPA